jgi:hypothetical protein
MKKILLLSAFAFLFSFNLEAQNKTIEINAAASTNSKNLRKQIKFNKSQEHQIYEAFVNYEKRILKLKENSKPKSASYNEEAKKIQAVLNNDIKQILSEEQYSLYLSLITPAY